MTAPMSGPIPPGPPFELDVLADLHAGVYPEDVAAVVRARVAADPEARAVLAALEATVADLHALPPIPMPTQVADRLDAVIAAEQAARAGRAAPRAAPVGGAAPAPPATAGRHPDGQVPPLPLPPQQAIGPDAPGPTPPALPHQQAGPPHRATGAAGRTGQTPGGRRTANPPPPAPPAPSPSAQLSSLDAARRARQQRHAAGRSRGPARWATGLGIAAAVAAVFTVGAVLLNPGGEPGTGMAGQPVGPTGAVPPATAPSTAGQPPGDASPSREHPPGNGAAEPAPTMGSTGGAPPSRAVVAEPHHLADLLPQIDGTQPAGPFADPARLAACLAANGAAGEHVLGVLPVSYTGKQAYAISLRTDTAEVRILVVGPQCGASGSDDLMEEQTTTG